MKINQIDIKEFNAFINTIDLKKISKDELIEYYKNSVATQFGAMAFTDRNKAERTEFLKNHTKLKEQHVLLPMYNFSTPESH